MSLNLFKLFGICLKLKREMAFSKVLIIQENETLQLTKYKSYAITDHEDFWRGYYFLTFKVLWNNKFLLYVIYLTIVLKGIKEYYWFLWAHVCIPAFYWLFLFSGTDIIWFYMRCWSMSNPIVSVSRVDR